MMSVSGEHCVDVFNVQAGGWNPRVRMDMQLPFPVTEGTSMEMKSREDLAVLAWRPLSYSDEQTGALWAFFGGTVTVTVLEPMRMLLTLTNAERCEVPALEAVEGFDTWSSLGANRSVLDEVEINFQVHRRWTLRRQTAAM